jgi:hypothetical protein
MLWEEHYNQQKGGLVITSEILGYLTDEQCHMEWHANREVLERPISGGFKSSCERLYVRMYLRDASSRFEASDLMTQIIIDLDHEAAKVTASLNETVDKVGESALALKSIVERRVEMARDIHELFAAQLRIDQVRKSNPDLFNKTEAANLNSRLNKVLADLPTTITKRPHIRAGGWVHRRDIATQASNYCRSRQGRVRGSPAQGD